MTQWGRRRLTRRSLQFLPPGVTVRRLVGAQTRGGCLQLLVGLAVFTPLYLLSGFIVFTGRWAGIGSFLPMAWGLPCWGLAWLVSLRVVAFRLLAVTDETVYVLDCGHNAFWWPKRLTGAFSRTFLETPTGRAGRVGLGAERLWVPVVWRRQLRWADWEFLSRSSLPAGVSAAGGIEVPGGAASM